MVSYDRRCAGNTSQPSILKSVVGVTLLGFIDLPAPLHPLVISGITLLVMCTPPPTYPPDHGFQGWVGLMLTLVSLVLRLLRIFPW